MSIDNTGGIIGGGRRKPIRFGLVLLSNRQILVVGPSQDVPGAFDLPGGTVERVDDIAESVSAFCDQAGYTATAATPYIEYVDRRGTTQFYRVLADRNIVADTARNGARAERTNISDEPGVTLIDRSIALNSTVFPIEVSEVVLRSWLTEEWSAKVERLSNAKDSAPKRVRAGAVVVREQGQVLLIERNRGRRTWYEIPGGGVEHGEKPEDAAVRELFEETGLRGLIRCLLAVIYKEGRLEYYFLVSDVGAASATTRLDLREGSRLVWLDISNLDSIPVWPKRLAWRISSWYRDGWPEVPIQLSDAVPDSRLVEPCFW